LYNSERVKDLHRKADSDTDCSARFVYPISFVLIAASGDVAYRLSVPVLWDRRSYIIVNNENWPFTPQIFKPSGFIQVSTTVRTFLLRCPPHVMLTYRPPARLCVSSWSSPQSGVL
jgi:hypothetical protein